MDTDQRLHFGGRRCPMATKRRQFSREFKEEAVRLWAESGRPLAQIARELTVRTEQLRRWRRQLGAVKADPAAARETEAQELRRLRRGVEGTRPGGEVLKKKGGGFGHNGSGGMAGIHATRPGQQAG